VSLTGAFVGMAERTLLQRFFEALTWDEIREWKAEQERKGRYP
jgi:hypothetical protein